MKFYKLIIMSVFCVLMGCANRHDQDYLQHDQVSPPLIVPQGVNMQQGRAYYRIPPLPSNDNPVPAPIIPPEIK